jgi:hypothetical protein
VRQCIKKMPRSVCRLRAANDLQAFYPKSASPFWDVV